MIESPDINLIDFVKKVVEHNSTLTLTLMVLFGLTWFVGLNVLKKQNEKRVGKESPWYAPWKFYNAKEWKFFLLLVIVSMSLGIAMVVSAKKHIENNELNKPPNKALNQDATSVAPVN